MLQRKFKTAKFSFAQNSQEMIKIGLLKVNHYEAIYA